MLGKNSFGEYEILYDDYKNVIYKKNQKRKTSIKSNNDSFQDED